MTEQVDPAAVPAFGAPPEPDSRRGGPHPLAVVVPAMVITFALVFGAFVLRRDGGATFRDRADALAELIVAPLGYELIDDGRSGAGRVTLSAATSKFSRTSPITERTLRESGYVAGYDRVWGRPAGQEPRAIVVFLAEFTTEAGARSVLLTARDAAPSPGSLAGVTDAFGVTGERDAQGRYYSSYVFRRGLIVGVVSVGTPEPQPAADAELAALARQQYDAL